MTTVSRVYGLAYSGSFSPVVEGSTTEGSGTNYVQSLGHFVVRDGACSLSFRVVYNNLTGAVGDLHVRCPDAPLPNYTVPIAFYLEGYSTGIGAGDTIQATINNIDSTCVIKFHIVDLAGGGAATDVSVGASGTISGTVTYPSG